MSGRARRPAARDPPARSPQRRRSWSRDHDEGRVGTVIMPPGSRRAIITPASAVRVGRSPPRQPSADMVARSATRPEASIRPNPYTTSGRPAGLASAPSDDPQQACPSGGG